MTHRACNSSFTLTVTGIMACSLLLLMAVKLTLTPDAAFAQTRPLAFQQRSFITPFPQSDRYYLHVIGDGLAEGLASGLEEAFKNDSTIKVINDAYAGNGLARPDRINWSAAIDRYAQQYPIHIAVIFMGLNDVRSVRTSTDVVRWGSDKWRDAYANEIDNLIKVLKDRNIAVYWVGLPVMADQKYSENLNHINTIIRERSYLGNVKFIDALSGFVDQNGEFSAYGPDLTGENQRLRNRDGISFTARGNRKLASYVEVLVRRDLNEARAERNIPLAGDEDEQVALLSKQEGDEENDLPDATEQSPASTDNNAAAASKSEEPSKNAATPQKTGEHLAPGGKAKTTAAPPTPSGAPSFRPGDAPPGETILGNIDEGVTSLATVSPMADLNAGINAGERRLPVTERLYYRILEKGESLKSKPNRADNFKWPRS
jgi:hypothetical protein